MIALVRSELLKLRTTRTALVLIGGMVALIVLVTLLNGLVTGDAFLIERKNQFQVLANGSIASAFTAILGVLSVTTEFRHGTVRPTFMVEPRRWRVLAAKLISLVLAGLVLGGLGLGLSYGIGELCIDSRNVPWLVTSGDVRLIILGGIAATVLWGLFGLAIGAIVRNQIGALVGLLIWSLFVEGIVFALVPSVGRFFPGQAASVLTQIETPHQLTVLAGVGLFCAYLVAAGLAGTLVTERRDVS